MNLLSDYRDIFYLKENEIFAYIKAPDSSSSMKELAEKRKNEMQRWKLLDPPNRIETTETIEDIEREFKNTGLKKRPALDSSILKGMVVAKTDRNRISGTALVLEDFDSNAVFEGKILVTRQTDPGWTIVFPSLTALVVERGGMLSHAAIVARELGIPCIVGVNDAVSRVQDGDQLDLDLKKGEVHVASTE